MIPPTLALADFRRSYFVIRAKCNLTKLIARAFRRP